MGSWFSKKKKSKQQDEEVGQKEKGTLLSYIEIYLVTQVPL